MAKAQYFLDRGEYDQAYNLTVSLWGRVSPRDKGNYLDLCRLLAFAAANIGHLDEAETYAGAGRREAQDSLDFAFLLAIVAAMRRDYEAAVEYSEVFESLLKEKREKQEGLEPWDKTIALRHQLLNAYGVALLERGQINQAERVLDEALELKPDDESTHINLNLLYRGQGRDDRAGKILERPESRPIKSVNEEYESKRRQGGPTVSVCMIVKNEEFFLPRCLSSVKSLADEIILVDTGSDDRTLDIAQEFGCKIHHYPWRGDFSAARNESLRHATRDWIFIIDADEELPVGEDKKIRYFIEKPDIDIVSISVYSKSPETGVVSSFLPSVRLFKRKLGLKFEGIVHNRLDIKPGTGVSRCDVKLYHYGYDLARDQLEKKLARSRALLERQLQENPADIFANFNMAQLLRGTKDAFTEETNRRIVEHTEKVLNHPEATSDKYYGQYIMAHYQAAAAYFNLKEYGECEKYCRKALELKSEYIDPLLTLGNTYCAINDFARAGEYYRRYLSELQSYNPELETHNIIMTCLDHEHIARYGLGIVAQNEDDIEGAIECYRKAVEKRENYLDCYMRLGRLYLDKSDPEKARDYFEKYIAQNEPSGEAFFGVGESFSMQQREEEAERYFARAVELNPANVHMRFRLGKTLLRLGNRGEGLDHIRQAAEEAGEDIGLIMEAADLLFHSGEYTGAAGFYGEIVELKPAHGDALNNLANCFFKAGDFRKAKETYERIIEKMPGYLLAYRNLGLTYYKLDEIERAFRILTDYTLRKPEDKEVFRLIGDLQFQSANYGEAIGAYEKYLGTYQDDASGWLKLADAYLQLGFGEAALLGYRKVLAIDPENAAVRARLKSLEELPASV